MCSGSLLSDVTILITTFLRDGYLLDCVRGIRQCLPECPVIVVDDGYMHEGKSVDMYLPFDSGLPAKRNVGAILTQTPYLLMGCDDFDFTTAREGIMLLRDIIPEVDVASGRVDNKPYEGFLEIGKGYIKEHPLVEDRPRAYYPVDLTVNYFLAKTEVVRKFPWDERMKIGGEHGDWFMDLKAAGRKVVWVPGVNINTLPEDLSKVHPDYNSYRHRAKHLGHKIMMEKRGLTRYLGFEDPL